jgi:hypothetical protein
MVTTHQQAVRIQKARHEAHKVGFAKAVARYIKRTAKAEARHINLAFLEFPAQVNRKKAKKAQEEE